MKVLVVDYGMGNLRSVCRALEECGAEPEVRSHPGALADFPCAVLPGVGAFPDGMLNLTRVGWVDALRKAVLQERKPLLGICLGMQLLADRGFEGVETQGLGLIPGEVRRLEPKAAERVPHVGWNETLRTAGKTLFDGVPEGTDFYFVHSYHFIPTHTLDASAWTPYAGRFVSAVARGYAYGVQFHPEKSSKPGFRLIRNFLDIAEGRKC